MSDGALRDLPLRLVSQLNWQRFWRGEREQAAPYVLHRRRVYILPTRFGLLFAVVLMVMLIGSINYVNSLGYLLTFLLTGLGLVGMVATYRNLLNLSLAFGRLRPVFAGDAAQVQVLIDNRDAPARSALTLRVPDSPAVTVDVDADQQSAVDVIQHNSQRGYRPVGLLTIETRFPLGLFRAWSPVNLRGGYLVYPRPAVTPQPLPDADAWRASVQGELGRGAEDFAGLRGYHRGDSLRHVHWKAVAREQGLLTKQFAGDRHEELWLDWHRTGERGTEARLSRLARWVLDAEYTGLRYGLRLPDAQLAPGHGPGHQAQALKLLALHGRADDDEVSG
ncbi:MAG: DUF58 domain-containing protein [Pseudomonadota bacterium]|nr:MAG: DUF58 domain-containing protein [Pseudomonadota bacterium]